MTKIYVTNGDWDKARSELGAQLDARKNAFDAKLAAVFAPARNAAADQPSKADGPQNKKSNSLLLARSRVRG